jgi:hypothetical protein|tara:strand:+ start:131 stop:589 length:459 start_codon:yes stop_codon:yes gene_type:complete
MIYIDNIIKTLGEAQDHLVKHQNDIEDYKPGLAIKLERVLEDCRVNYYYNIESEFKFVKKAINSMSFIRKLQREKLFEFIIVSLKYLINEPSNYFKSVFYFKNDAEQAIMNYWLLKNHLKQYEEVEKTTTNVLNIMFEMSKIQKEFFKKKNA